MPGMLPRVENRYRYSGIWPVPQIFLVIFLRRSLISVMSISVVRLMTGVSTLFLIRYFLIALWAVPPGSVFLLDGFFSISSDPGSDLGPEAVAMHSACWFFQIFIAFFCYGNRCFRPHIFSRHRRFCLFNLSDFGLRNI